MYEKLKNVKPDPLDSLVCATLDHLWDRQPYAVILNASAIIIVQEIDKWPVGWRECDYDV